MTNITKNNVSMFEMNISFFPTSFDFTCYILFFIFSIIIFRTRYNKRKTYVETFVNIDLRMK